MMNTSRTLVAAAALAVSSFAIQAQTPIYFDAVDWLQYPVAYPAATPNLYLTNGAPILADLGDGTANWRYRNTGPGIPSWNTNSYQIRYSEGDVPGYIALTGLAPNTGYWVAIYGVYPQNTTNAPLPGSRYGIFVNYDGGTTYATIDNRGAVPIHWVDNSTDLGVESPTVHAGDNRFYSWVPDLGQVMTDGAGNANIYFFAPNTLSDGSVPDRFILDGVALFVPEPSTFALAGLGAAAMLIFRRRR